ncbi:hypothetical protein GCM10017056_04370 [Seohaeicola zhoushanensis]|uniref:Uncharacterized protein n=1 Tax=Seohaeicola zhoushanensis TaxID=1569283 RepID=A0A8J3GUC8_9RHOB|nr:hypothetical protein GCM10017056_04370 [Seohaeicola zhoushanensis]
MTFGIKDPPGICVVVPAGIGMRNSYVETPGATLVFGGHMADHRRIGKGGAGGETGQKRGAERHGRSLADRAW